MDCNDNDLCPICKELLFHPTSANVCGHATCRACLLMWIATSKPDPRPLDPSFRISSEPKTDDISLACPLCRRETTFSPDDSRSSQLELTYSTLYQQRAIEDAETDRFMTIQLGNTHKRTPPSISPYTGVARTHHWTFFLNSSHTHLIDSVDLILHESFNNHRFVTLRKPPFTKSSLGWGWFRFTTFVTLRDGWEWESPTAMNSMSKARGRRDRLPVPCALDFKDRGSQSLAVLPFRRIETMDEILMSLRHLFIIA
jgi:hypothetical protein